MKINAKEYKTNEIIKFIREGLNLTQEQLSKVLLKNMSMEQLIIHLKHY